MIIEDSDADSESLLIGAVNYSQGKNWTETVDFGNMQIVFKLDTGPQSNVLPKCNFAALLDKTSCEELNLIQRVDQVRDDNILTEFPNPFHGVDGMFTRGISYNPRQFCYPCSACTQENATR